MFILESNGRELHVLLGALPRLDLFPEMFYYFHMTTKWLHHKDFNLPDY